MTSRRCMVLEQGACEQLRLHGYKVRIIPTGNDRRLPPAHLVACRSGETRYIRIYKLSYRPATIDTVEQYFSRVILRYRTEMARHPYAPIRYECWLYRLKHGYHCFAILSDRILEIPPTGKLPVHILVEGTP